MIKVTAIVLLSVFGLLGLVYCEMDLLEGRTDGSKSSQCGPHGSLPAELPLSPVKILDSPILRQVYTSVYFPINFVGQFCVHFCDYERPGRKNGTISASVHSRSSEG